jgi:hypothetical protein
MIVCSASRRPHEPGEDGHAKSPDEEVATMPAGRPQVAVWSASTVRGNRARAPCLCHATAEKQVIEDGRHVQPLGGGECGEVIDQFRGQQAEFDVSGL